MEKFQRAQTQGHLPHGWLLCGPHGVGKRTAAHTLIRHLFGGGKKLTSHDSRFHRIALEIHGDFFRGDQIVISFLHKAPGEGLLRLILIPDADLLTLNSSNPLLKILEEPVPHTFFLSNGPESGVVLPTVRSRCRPIHLFPASTFQVFFDHLNHLFEAQEVHLPSCDLQQTLWGLTKG